MSAVRGWRCAVVVATALLTATGCAQEAVAPNRPAASVAGLTFRLTVWLGQPVPVPETTSTGSTATLVGGTLLFDQDSLASDRETTVYSATSGQEFSVIGTDSFTFVQRGTSVELTYHDRTPATVWQSCTVTTDGRTLTCPNGDVYVQP